MKAIASFVRLSTWIAAVWTVTFPGVARAEEPVKVAPAAHESAASPAPPPLAAAPAREAGVVAKAPTAAAATTNATPAGAAPVAGSSADSPSLEGSPATSGAAPATSGAAPATSGAAPAAGFEAPPAGAPKPAVDPLPANIDGATYRVRLRDLEQRVDELKEKIRQSHTRLSLLSDTVLSGAAGGARAEVVLENDLSGAWRLVEAVVVLDGAVQYKKTDDTGVLAEQKRIPIFTGSIPSGDHVVQVMLKLRGHGFGVFSYLKGIEATVRNDYSFTVSDGKLMELRAIAWEQGGPTTPVEEQPTIRFVESVRAMGDIPRSSSPAPLSSTPPKPPGPAPQGAAPPPAGKPELKGGAAGANVGAGASSPSAP